MLIVIYDFQLNCIFLLEIMNYYHILLPCCRKKDGSQETDFKDAVELCLPLINAAIRDALQGTFPKSCFLNVEIPTSPLSSKVHKFYYSLDNNIYCNVRMF